MNEAKRVLYRCVRWWCFIGIDAFWAFLNIREAGSRLWCFIGLHDLRLLGIGWCHTQWLCNRCGQQIETYGD